MRARLYTKALALIAALGIVRPAGGAPGDVLQMAAPMLGADPPKGADIRDGDASVSTQTGALEYSYPIDVPPGRLGNQPRLSLGYSSQAPLYGDIAAGWSLPIPEIRRDFSQGAVAQFRFGDAPEPTELDFLSTMAGSRPLVEIERPTGDVARRLRAQNDTSYTDYEQMVEGHPFKWRALSPDGTTYIFGDVDRIQNGSTRDRVPLTRTIDPFGNTVEYLWTYHPDRGYRLDEILYTSNPAEGLPAFARVHFVWSHAPTCGTLPVGASESRRGHSFASGGGREVTGGFKLDQIVATAFDPATSAVEHTRQITLGYHASAMSCTADHAPVRLLTSIQESAWGPDAPRVDLPPVTFRYGDPGIGGGMWRQYGSFNAVDAGLSQGERYLENGKMWPRVDAMLLDLDGDGLVDRLRAHAIGDECYVDWERNEGSPTGFVYAGRIEMPRLEWGDVLPSEGCSLNGQRSHHDNTGQESGECPQGPDVKSWDDTYLAYRWLDLDGDGLVELVTAIHADADVYDPNALDEAPFGPWPACDEDPACVVLDEECVEDAIVSCDPNLQCDPETQPAFDPGAFEACADTGLDMACGALQACDREGDTIYCDSLTSSVCGPPRDAHERCGRYPWIIYDNHGGGQIDTQSPRIVYSPIPLEAYNDDSPSGAGGFTSSQHAIIDLDGDGLLDAVNAINEFDYEVSYFWTFWKGDGTGNFHGDEAGRSYFWFTPFNARPATSENEVFEPNDPRDEVQLSPSGLADLNADGLPDYYERDPVFGDVLVYWNGGVDGFQWGPSRLAGGDVKRLSSTQILADPGALGDGFFVKAGVATRRVELLDLDDDGRADLIESARLQSGAFGDTTVRFSDGADLLDDETLRTPDAYAIRRHTHARDNGGQYLWETRHDYLDIDGDGQGERVEVVGEPATVRIYDRDDGGKPPRLLVGIDNGSGLHVEARYAPLSDTSVVTSDAWNRKASPQTRWVVASLTTTDDFESSASTSEYDYVNPVWSPDDRGDWGFRGFETVRTTGPRGAVSEERYGYDVDWSGRLVATLTFPAEGGGDEPTSIGETTYQRFTLYDDAIETFHPTATRSWTCEPGQTEEDCRANPAGLVQGETVWTPLTAIGSPELRMHAVTVERTIEGETYDAGDRQTTTSYALLRDADAYRLRPLGAVSTWRNGLADETFARSATVWDPTYRMALEEHVWSDASTVAITEYDYDDDGLVNVITKPEQRDLSGAPSTTLKYDDARRFVVTTFNEKDHRVDTVHHAGTGALLRTTGPNPNEEERTDIDGLGRPIASWISRTGGAGPELVKVAETIYDDTPDTDPPLGPTSITSRSLVDYGGTVWTQTVIKLDGHGRPIESIESGGAGPATTTYDYDVDGSLLVARLPDPSGGSGPVTYDYRYDSLGRPISMRRPDGTAITGSGIDLEYEGLTHRRIEVAGVNGGPAAKTELVHDAFGRLVVVREHLDGAGVASTFYQYSPRDEVAWIDDADGVTTELTHDWMGRRIGINREGRKWTYGYDRNGNLAFEQSPVPQGELPSSFTTTYAYDDLDRVAQRIVAPRALPLSDRQLFGIGTVVYSYDDATPGANRIGRLHRITLPSYGASSVLQTTYAYDLEGNVTEDRRAYNLGGVTGTRRIKSTYGPGGRAKEVDLGDGTTVDGAATLARYAYDNRAAPQAVDVKLIGGTYRNVATFTRNVAGMVVSRTRPPLPLEPNQVATWSYDTLGRVTRQRVTTGTSTVVANQDLTYWGNDDVRTLTHTGSGLSARSFSYTYDRRHQLTGVTTSQGNFSSSYAFTPGGRLSRAQVTATTAAGSDVRNRNVDYIYDAVDPEMLSALRTVGGGGDFATYEYDDAGNVKKRTQQGAITTLTWDGDDQLRRAVVGTNREEYYYDASGQRVGLVKRGNNGSIQQVKYFHGPLEVWLSASGTATNRLAHVALGTPVARVESTSSGSTLEVQYHGTLQSLLASIAPSGTVTSSFAYGPYGEVLQTTGTQLTSHRRRYNDKQQDELTGLLYYGYRYYDSVSLTWNAADPMYRFVPDAAWGDPRRADLYSFNLGNPIRFVDPDGREPDVNVFVNDTIRQRDAGLQGRDGIDIAEVGSAAASFVADTVVDGVKGPAWVIGEKIYGIGTDERGVARAYADEVPGLGMGLAAADALERGDKRTAALLVILAVAEVAPGSRTATAPAKGALKQVVKKQTKKSTAKAAGGAVAKKRGGKLPTPPKGPGAVPRSKRDTQRSFPPKQREAKRRKQKYKCADGCGTTIDASNSEGHHRKRWADGGKTVPENHDEVCKDCHRGMHR